MLEICAPSKQRVLDQLAEAFHARLDGQDACSLVRFAQQFYSVSASRDLNDAGIERLYAKVLCYWNSIQVFDAAGPRIELFNPGFEKQGWHSSHTVVQVHNLDMPFLVDSVRMALHRQGLAIHAINNCVIRVERDPTGQLLALTEPGAGQGRGQAESVIQLEIDRHTDPGKLQRIAESLQAVLADVVAAVTDYPAMASQVGRVKLAIGGEAETDSFQTHVKEFLDWLLDDHFVFLGYQRRSVRVEQGGVVILDDPGAFLGTLRLGAAASDPALAGVDRPGAVLTDLIGFAKEDQRSRVHRPAYQDVIRIRQFDGEGKAVAEHRFLGLYTSAVYADAPEQIPLVRQKVRTVLEGTGFEPGGHSYRQVQQILKQMPRDELLLASAEELRVLAMGIFDLQERRKASLFIRRDDAGRYYSCLYLVPRDLYNTALREKVQAILAEGLGAVDVEMSAGGAESMLLRTHFVVYVNSSAPCTPDLAAIEARVLEASRSWEEDLQPDLVEAFGEEQGSHAANLFQGAFPSAYKEHFSSGNAVCDIQHIQQLSGESDIALRFYRPLDREAQGLKFKLYSGDTQVVLSDVIPLLENLGMRVLGEHPYIVRRRDGQRYWIGDFSVSCPALDVEDADLEQVKPLIQEAFSQVWAGKADSDAFNQLVMSASLGWRDVALLRAYARYNKQLRFGFSHPFVAATLVRNLAVTRLLVALFRARFAPADLATDERYAAADKIEQDIREALESVDSLDDDRILRRFLVLIKATLRTNYFQREPSGAFKAYLSFKLAPQSIPDIPLPRPMYEVFVYSPQVEGVHLRVGKVARGGLRWSDRMEDYRTEVLGLVKAQQVKNSVIVPMGAKGCFIVKQAPVSGGREAFQAAGVAGYRTFIRGLLDLTDNRLGGKILPPPDVVRHDDDDPYLVVAADKGTATFSDIANDISNDYGFWLGDAFASGGSQGYDHKKMGITARGAWESVKRHFRERDVDTQTQGFSVLGIGDMGGDVFGNGMLLSESIKLVAAFNHLHIFVDPTPDAGLSHAERKRLFALPRSSWADYDASLISAGGGIFPRSAKWIYISPQMQSAFGIEADRLAPGELISALLKAPVDMIWNGGIGTYVKAKDESHEAVGDKANDGLRVNGRDLRAKVLGEGGNLGFTQRGRIEFARRGGAANTDFIDNAGGVDCSDHEVNIKILLNERVQQGDMTLKQRNQLLRDMTDDVAALVLKNNYRQAQALNIADASSCELVDEHLRFMRSLEKAGKLDRALEFLPSDRELLARKDKGQGLTRPELAVLISYAKIELKQVLVDSWITEDPCFARELETAFPRRLQDEFPDALRNHRLRREIVATQIANDLVNRMGITFVHSVRSATGADFSRIAATYLIVREVFRVSHHWDAIEALDGQVSSATQVDMMRELIRLVQRASYWILRQRRYDLDLSACVAAYRDSLADAVSSLEQLSRIIPEDRWQEKFARFREQAVPELLAACCASAESQYWLLDIIEIARHREVGIVEVASAYFVLGERLDLVWLDRQILAFTATSHWQAVAASSYRNELDDQLRLLTQRVFEVEQDDQSAPGISALLELWFRRQHPLLERWRQTLNEIQGMKVTDCAVFSVALRVLRELA
ncbi:NAD-glutamate dehydrogenase [Marinobacterium sedimentorum]|uniref:NAD-glutamate dehydrogenase n=1 Tax=Marinobacterium sedimentorum TaxID=2927804 RepID=UPI0020C6C68F|nr:NAD-glutamate dehydrogenase [Marinobacterium sedimentorum]MCP8690353.1 NAD-glutamate dehydrogenase [Marinobacterium sedimentorum]